MNGENRFTHLRYTKALLNYSIVMPVCLRPADDQNHDTDQ